MLQVSSDPMSQFELKRLLALPFGEFDLSFTNAAATKFLIVGLIVALMWFAASRASLVPNRLQAAVEILYEFVRNTVLSTIGEKGLAYFPLIFTLFSFILVANLLGMFPYAFTVTSHISVTLALGLLVFVMVLAIGFGREGIGFVKRFYPSGAPWWIAWFIAIIELISFLIRPFTLAVRLFANMLAGHTMLKVLGSFIPLGLAAGGIGIAGALGAGVLGVGVTALEFLVAGLQAYVFTILTCIYLAEVVHDPHH